MPLHNAPTFSYLQLSHAISHVLPPSLTIELITQTGYHYCLAVLADTSDVETRGLYAEACRPAAAGIGVQEEDEGEGQGSQGEGGEAGDAKSDRGRGGRGRGRGASGSGRGRVRYEEQPSLSRWLLENTHTMACARCRHFVE